MPLRRRQLFNFSLVLNKELVNHTFLEQGRALVEMRKLGIRTEA
jgi:hypothetical protein